MPEASNLKAGMQLQLRALPMESMAMENLVTVFSFG